MTKGLTFIASGGRTGTQFFGDILGQVIADCHSEHEPDMVAGLSMQTLARMRRFGFWHMGPGRVLGRTGVRVIGQAYLEGKIDKATCANRLRASRRIYHASISEPLVVESYYAWWMVADIIGDIWPGAKLAGILRDPRDWIASWLRHAPLRRRGALTEWLPPGPLEPKKLGDTASSVLWSDLDQVGRLAWEWSLIAQTLSQASVNSANVRIFRFEDLFGGGEEKLSQFVEFLVRHNSHPDYDINDLSSKLSDVRNASFGRKREWHTWNDRQISAVSHFCGSLMASYGYGTEPEWQDRIETAGDLVKSSGH